MIPVWGSVCKEWYENGKHGIWKLKVAKSKFPWKSPDHRSLEKHFSTDLFSTEMCSAAVLVAPSCRRRNLQGACSLVSAIISRIRTSLRRRARGVWDTLCIAWGRKEAERSFWMFFNFDMVWIISDTSSKLRFTFSTPFPSDFLFLFSDGWFFTRNLGPALIYRKR